jgi:hypothetical protein
MELSAYQLLIAGLAIIAHTAGAVAYISKVKNDLSTRVTVLEAGYSMLKFDINEIKKDVKELLAWVHTEQGKK